MNGRIAKIGRIFLIVIVSVLLTSFTIDATDTFRTSQTALGILAGKATEKNCPDEMVLVDRGEYKFCLDIYEASVGEECLILEPKTAKDTAANISYKDCLPNSSAGQLPWVNVAQPQAEMLCAKVGKRLPTAKEWYQGALGTVDSSDVCNIAEGKVTKTGAWSLCKSGVGAFDMVGNVWELVGGQIEDATYEGKGLPLDGYVAMVDDAGVAYVTATSADPIFNNDYFWADSFGRYVMMRGGYFGSRNDGGIYSVHAKTESSFASAAVGFRCAQSL